MRPSRMVEALLFASDAPLAPAEIARIGEGLDEEQVEALISELREEYEREGRAFDVFEIAGGYQLLTRPEFRPVLERFDTVPSPSASPPRRWRRWRSSPTVSRSGARRWRRSAAWARVGS